MSSLFILFYLFIILFKLSKFLQKWIYMQERSNSTFFFIALVHKNISSFQLRCQWYTHKRKKIKENKQPKQKSLSSSSSSVPYIFLNKIITVFCGRICHIDTQIPTFMLMICITFSKGHDPVVSPVGPSSLKGGKVSTEPRNHAQTESWREPQKHKTKQQNT